MITFTIVLAGLFLCLAWACAFIAWVIREHLIANKYRHLIKLYELMPKEEPTVALNKGPAWKFVYKVKSKRKELIVAAATDSAALVQFVKITGGNYDSILEMVSI